MASILDRYGIKEVADVTFHELKNGKPNNPVLYLDTLKVSTIEQTAETTEARGGKGNAALISWDYGKEINVTLEDALFSAKSMAIMFGNGVVNPLVAGTEATNRDNANIMRTEVFQYTSATIVAATAASASGNGWDPNYTDPKGASHSKRNPKFFDATGATATQFVKDEKYFCSYDLATENLQVIEISANSFPGTYYVTGDTFARSEADGTDEFFQFIIPKAKVTAENTITLEAEGDPSVFNMSLKVLRPEDGVMMKLVKYDLGGTESTNTNLVSDWIHNHTLEGTDTQVGY